MRIAVIGAGISGLASAWLLGRQHEVTLFEAGDYLGGHTHTHDIELGGKAFRVDTGFIVFNPEHYPLLTALFDELGVASRPTTMSFSVHNQASGLEYNATSLRSLFCQKRNLLSPRFLGMLRDLIRFYREAPALLRPEVDADTAALSIGEYLERNRYGAAFRDDHLLPMASALWSSPTSRIREFPARYLLQFMANHQMLQVSGRPEWRTVAGGSNRYVQALRARWSVDERLGSAVRSVQRRPSGVEVLSDHGCESFDQVVMACHSDQTLSLIHEPTHAEREILGAIPYQPNEVTLHTDARLLPRNPRAWAAWNAHVPADPSKHCTVSYCMNQLQGLDAPEPLIVSLNRGDEIDPQRVLRRMRYSHPVYTRESVAAQERRQEIQGRDRLWFAGAYWGWGFHEDGLRSAVEVAASLGIRWPGGCAAPLQQPVATGRPLDRPVGRAA